MNKYSKIFQTPYINTYQAPDINTFANAASLVRDRYDTSMQYADLLEESLGQIEAAPFEEDQRMLRELKATARAQAEEWAEQGNYEDIFPAIKKSTRNFANQWAPIQQDKALWDEYKEGVMGLENLSEQQKAIRLALGSEGFKGLSRDEHGEWDYFSGDKWNEGINVPEWTDNVLKDTEFDSYSLYDALDNGYIKTDTTGRYIVTESGVRESRDAVRIANVLNAAIEGDNAMQGYIADEARIAEATIPLYEDLDKDQLKEFESRLSEYREIDEFKDKTDQQIYDEVRAAEVNNSVIDNIFSYGEAKYKFSRLKSYNQNVKADAYALEDYKNSLKDSMGFGKPGPTLPPPGDAPAPSLHETQRALKNLKGEVEDLANKNASMTQTFLSDPAVTAEVQNIMEEEGASQRDAIKKVAAINPAYREFYKGLIDEENTNAEYAALSKLHEQDLAQMRLENPEDFIELDAFSAKHGIEDPTDYDQVMEVLEAHPAYKPPSRSSAPLPFDIAARVGERVLKFLDPTSISRPETAAEAVEVLEALTEVEDPGFIKKYKAAAASKDFVRGTPTSKAAKNVDKAYKKYKRNHLPPAKIATTSYTHGDAVELAESVGKEILFGNAGQFTAADGKDTPGESIKTKVLKLGDPEDLVVTGSIATGYYSASGSNVVYSLTYTDKSNGKQKTFNVYRNSQSPKERDFVNNLMVETYGYEGVADAMLTQGNKYGVTYRTAEKLAANYVMPFQGLKDTYLYKAGSEGDVSTFLTVVPALPGDEEAFTANDGVRYKPRLLGAKPAPLREVFLRNSRSGPLPSYNQQVKVPGAKETSATISSSVNKYDTRKVAANPPIDEDEEVYTSKPQGAYQPAPADPDLIYVVPNEKRKKIQKDVSQVPYHKIIPINSKHDLYVFKYNSNIYKDVNYVLVTPADPDANPHALDIYKGEDGRLYKWVKAYRDLNSFLEATLPDEATSNK